MVEIIQADYCEGETMFERILLPTDFSAATERVFAATKTMARRYSARIHLIHVDEERALGMHSSDDLIHFMNDVDARRKEWMEQLADDLGQEGFAVDLHRLEGAASDEIIAYAQRLAIGLIVMGTRGEVPIAKVLLGSTSKAVLRSAPCPVLSINHELMEPGPFVVRKVLFPTDFSKTSLAGLGLAAQLARDFEASVELLHVLKAPTYIPAIPGEPPFYVPRQAFATAHERSVGMLAAISTRSELEGLSVAYDAILAGDTAHGIVTHAQEKGCNIIVIPRAGHGVLRSLLFGRVVAHVIKLSPFPVLSFRPEVG